MNGFFTTNASRFVILGRITNPAELVRVNGELTAKKELTNFRTIQGSNLRLAYSRLVYP